MASNHCFLSRYKRDMTNFKCIANNKTRIQARRVLKEPRRSSFATYISIINAQTSITQIYLQQRNLPFFCQYAQFSQCVFFFFFFSLQFTPTYRHRCLRYSPTLYACYTPAAVPCALFSISKSRSFRGYYPVCSSQIARTSGELSLSPRLFMWKWEGRWFSTNHRTASSFTLFLPLQGLAACSPKCVTGHVGGPDYYD